MSDMYDTFAKNLRARRCELGLTQAALGEMLHYSEKSISKWESGAAIPGIDVLLRLTQLLGTDLNSILGFNAKASFFLGIDGAPTATTFALANDDGHIIRTLSLEPCNPDEIGMKAAQDILETGIGEICNGIARRRISVFAGICGDMKGDTKNALNNLFERLNFGKVQYESDTENAVASALHGEDGVAVIVGTDSVVYAIQEGLRKKIGGYGHFFDKGGNAYTLGRECIYSVLRELDGSGPHTLMTELASGRVGRSFAESLADFYNRGKNYVASFAPIVFEAQAKGDAVAKAIIEESFSYLADQIRAGLNSFGEIKQIHVSLAGSLTSMENAIRPILEQELKDYAGVRLHFCRKPAVYGALMLAGAPVFKSGEYCVRLKYIYNVYGAG